MSGATFADVLALLVVIATIVASAFLGHHTLPRRALAVVAVMLGTCVLTSALLRAVPGDPVVAVLGEDAPPDARRALGQELGLVDEHGTELGVVAQLGRFVRGAVAAAVLTVAPASIEKDLSLLLPAEPRSFRTSEPVRVVVLRRLPATLKLAFASMLIAIVAGIGLGAIAAYRQRRLLGLFAEVFSLAGVAIPRFWLAPLLVLVFSLWLRWLPPSGADEGLRSLVLPAISLGTALAALLARLTRGAVLDALSEDFIRTARAKGLDDRTILFKHALPAGLIPVVTVLGMQFGALLAGSIVTEKVFAWPGIGLLLLESIRRLDVPVVQGVVLTVALGTALASLAVEAITRVLDPRLRRAM